MLRTWIKQQTNSVGEIMHGKYLLKFCNVIQIPKNFTSLTIDLIWICLLKTLNTKNAVPYSAVDQRMFSRLQFILYHQQGNSAVFLPVQKTLHEFLLKILPRSTRKISTLKKNVFPVFRFQQKTDTFFCHQEGTDTRIFYHAKILDQSLDIDTTVDAEDANVIIIAAYVSTTLQKKMI